jgi:hypothetical protein
MSATMIAGCGGQLYKVAPLPVKAPPAITSSNTGGLNLGARVLEGDQSVEQFEANLLLAGVIPIDVKIVNQSSGSISAKELKFELNDEKEFKQIQPKKALNKVMDYYGDSFYRLDARKRTQESYEAIALKLQGTIEPGEFRRGFIFFETDLKKIGGLTLSVTGAGAPVTVNVAGTPEELQKYIENQRSNR